MSTLERFNLLSPILDSLDEAWPNNDPVLCSEDAATVVTAFRAWLVVTSDILEQLGYSTQSNLDRVGRLCTSVQLFLPSEILLACKTSYDVFLDIISGKKASKDALYVCFKGELANRGIAPLLIDALVAPVNKVFSAITTVVIKRNDCWLTDYKDQLRSLAQYFGFLMKVELRRPDLEESALNNYIQFEAEFPELDLNNKYLDPLRTIIMRWMANFSYEGSQASHGDGSVANAPASILQKYRNIEVDATLEYLYKPQGDLLGISRYFPLGSKRTLKRVSRLCFVPKNVSKLRSISMEPAALQFVQQGAMKRLYRYIRKHPYLGPRVKLEDQGQNKSFAYHGSVTDEYSTIDLSAASDSVAYSLVKYLFGGNTRVWRWLLCTRSTHTLLPNGKEILLKKYAPMGSSLCFPIETLIFAAIAELAVQIGREKGTTQDVETGIYKQFYTVYGDDIIIPKGAYNIAREILVSLNFKVNEDKSYHNSPFKESCGGNFLAGVDITPIKWNAALPNGKMLPDTFVALCSKANQAQEHSYKLLRMFCLHLIEGYGKTPYFVSALGLSPGVYSPTPTNFKARWRSLERLQANEISFTSIGPSPIKPISDIDAQDIESIAYCEWLRQTEGLNKPRFGLIKIKGERNTFEHVYCKERNNKSYVQCVSVFKRGRVITYERCVSAK